MRHPYLFNFAASYSSGGLKRLQEYARCLDADGGAGFIIHPRCDGLRAEFPRNRYFTVHQSALTRLVDDCGYLRDIVRQFGRPQFYYSYGIPLYGVVGEVDWFHLSNVLPVLAWTAPLTLPDRLKFALLGRRIRHGLRFAGVISAESRSSIEAMGDIDTARAVVSVNGSDDELALLRRDHSAPTRPVATAVGTYRYKALADSVRVFERLRGEGAAEGLHVFGNPDWVPRQLRQVSRVEIRGNVPRAELIEWLQASRFYVSTTRIENSYNAAAEGVFCAEESYVSNIGPHRELLAGASVNRVRIAGVPGELLHVRRQDLDPSPLKTWSDVVGEMLARFELARRGGNK